MHIHPERLANISNERILKIFVEAKSRRLEFERLEDIGSSNGHFFYYFLILGCFFFHTDLHWKKIFRYWVGGWARRKYIWGEGFDFTGVKTIFLVFQNETPVKSN